MGKRSIARLFDLCALPSLLMVTTLASPLRAQSSRQPGAQQPPAQQQPPARSPSFSLRMTAPDGCPGETELVKAILARVPEARRVGEADAEMAFGVEISDGGTSTLSVSLPEGASRRELHETSCEEAAATLALIAALVLDARPGERLQATERAPAGTAAAPGVAAAAAPPPAQSAPRSETVQSPASELEPKSKGVVWRFGFQLAAALETAVAPAPPLGGMLGVSLQAVRQSWWSPELRADLLLTTSASEAVPPGEVQLRLTTARISACPLQGPVLAVLVVAGCATFDAGGLSASGSPEIQGRSTTMPWLALGMAARARLTLRQAWGFELSAGLKRLLHHDIFTLEPGQTAYDVPALSAGFSAGLAVSF